MTRQQEYEAKLLREARQIKLCRIILFILFLSLWELTAFFRNDQPFYIQLPLPDPFVSVSHVFG